MNSVLPLEVLGLIGPILCWVERMERPGLPGVWYGDEFPFKDRMKAWLMRDLPNFSYDSMDEIIQLARSPRNPCRFPDEPRRTKKPIYKSAPPAGFDLVHIFEKLSEHYFSWAGNQLRVRKGRLVELHELAMRFPVCHLVRYCHARAAAGGYITEERARELPVQMNRLHTLCQGLCTVVEKGICEGHLHLNGIIGADEAWPAYLLGSLSPNKLKGLSKEDSKLILLGYTALRMLALGICCALTGYDNVESLFDLIVSLDRLYRSNPAANPAAEKKLKDELKNRFSEKLKKFREYLRSEKITKFPREYDWLMLLVGPGMQRLQRKEKGGGPGQGIVEIKGIRNRIKLLENIHFEVLRILIRDNQGLTGPNRPGDAEKTIRQTLREFIHQVFIRYLVYHTHHWQRATQSGKTTGLQYFKHFYESKQRSLPTEYPDDYRGLAVERLFRDSSLRCVEGRLMPPSAGFSKYRPWLVAFARHADDGNLDKFGLVIHFDKCNKKKSRERTCFNDTLNLRDGKIRRQTRTGAFKLFHVLTIPNPATPFIVGIDAANLELAVSPEVFAPAFRFLREYPIELRRPTTARGLFGKYPEIAGLVKNRRLGMTYHVGEDFHHLLSGLRAIHEVVEFLDPRPGDRLGHAIALALEPGAWAAQMGNQAVLPGQEWLDSLVWIYYLLGPGHDLIGRLGVESEIHRFSRKIYGKSVPGNNRKRGKTNDWMPNAHHDSWLLRQLDPYSLDLEHPDDGESPIRRRGNGAVHTRWADIQNRVFKDVKDRIGTGAAYELLWLYWYDPGVRKNGSDIVKIDIQANEKKNLWLEVFREAQQRVKEKVREKQLVVEVNPSSNRVVGPMEKMADHPIFKLTLDKENRLSRQIRVTVNTDNPGVFTTSLSHEFYMLGETLINRDVPEAEVVEWLDWLRKNGKEYSFLLDLPDVNDKHVKAIIDCLLKKYPSLLRRLKGERRQYKPLRSRFYTEAKRVEEPGKLKQGYQRMEARIERLYNEIEELRRKYEKQK